MGSNGTNKGHADASLDKNSVVVRLLGSSGEVNGCNEPHTAEKDRWPHWHLHHSPWEVNIVRWKALCRVPQITFEGIYCAVGNGRATFLDAYSYFSHSWNTSNCRGNFRSTLSLDDVCAWCILSCETMNLTSRVAVQAENIFLAVLLLSSELLCWWGQASRNVLVGLFRYKDAGSDSI